jgi:hypothetical protein
MKNAHSTFADILQPPLEWIVNAVQWLAPEEWTFVVGMLVMLAAIGWRLKNFSKPEWHFWGAVIRDCSKPFLFWPSLLGLAIAIVMWAAFFMICYVLDVLPQAAVELRREIVGAGFGVFGGLVPSAIIVYALIPLIELPDITLAHPHAKVRGQKNFNPERYFRD